VNHSNDLPWSKRLPVGVGYILSSRVVMLMFSTSTHAYGGRAPLPRIFVVSLRSPPKMLGLHRNRVNAISVELLHLQLNTIRSCHNCRDCLSKCETKLYSDNLLSHPSAQGLQLFTFRLTNFYRNFKACT
jgi:hypothetical protein